MEGLASGSDCGRNVKDFNVNAIHGSPRERADEGAVFETEGGEVLEAVDEFAGDVIGLLSGYEEPPVGSWPNLEAPIFRPFHHLVGTLLIGSPSEFSSDNGDG